MGSESHYSQQWPAAETKTAVRSPRSPRQHWIVLRKVRARKDGDNSTSTSLEVRLCGKSVLLDKESFIKLVAPTEFNFVSVPDPDCRHWMDKLCSKDATEGGPCTQINIQKSGEVTITANMRLIFEQMFEMNLCEPHSFECWWRISSSKPLCDLLPKTSSCVHSTDIDGIAPVATPQALLLPLLLHQRRSLAWMLHRETSRNLFVCEGRHPEPIGHVCVGPNSVPLTLDARLDQAFDIRGGLLCDPIGSGKTATILALVCETLQECQSKQETRSDGSLIIPATLILCPANVHRHWIDEAEKFCKGSLRVLALHTVAELHARSRAELMSADLVIAPYEIMLEPEYRDLATPWSGDTATLSPRAPAAPVQEVLSRSNISSFVDGSPHSANATRRDARHSVRSSPGRPTRLVRPLKRGCGCALEFFIWHRVVLDEFHELCTGRSSCGSPRNDYHRRVLWTSFRALRSTKRWGLSGTPEAFKDQLVEAARLFRCELSPRSAPLFLEHFCRRARVHIDVEVQEHKCPVFQTAPERTIYLQKLRDHVLPEILHWSDSESFGQSIRELIRCCSHFSVGSGLTAYEECERTLKLKHQSVHRLQADYLAAFKNSWMLTCRRWHLLQDLLTALNEKQSVLANLVSNLQVARSVGHEQIVRNQESLQRQSQSLKYIIAVGASEHDLEGVWRLVASVILRGLQPSSRGKASLSRSSSSVEGDGRFNPVTAFIDLCTGASAMASHIPSAMSKRNQTDENGSKAQGPIAQGPLPQAVPPVWSLSDELRIFVDKLNEFGKESTKLRVQYTDAIASYEFQKQIWDALASGAMSKEECPVCFEQLHPTNTYLPRCAHPICGGCLQKLVSNGQGKCPICRFRIPQLEDAVRLFPEDMLGKATDEDPSGEALASSSCQKQDQVLAYLKRKTAEISEKSTSAVEIDARRDFWGSKLRGVVEKVEEIRASDPRAKIVIFVQWDDIRDELGKALSQASINRELLRGNIFERTRALKTFQNNTEVPLLLLSLQDSASGTNLTCASHVILVHPMLAATLKEARAAEMQAIGRVRRFGQQRKVHIWRFFTKHSVEESLWDLVKDSDKGLFLDEQDVDGQRLEVERIGGNVRPLDG